MSSTDLALHYIGQRLAALESYQPDAYAAESFAIFRQLENLLYRVVATFKLNLTKGFKDFKRGELRAYQESHHGDLRVFFTQKKWVTLNHVPIPVPKSLHRPYLTTAEHVSELLKDAHYQETIALMTGAVACAWDKGSATPAETVTLATDNLTKLWGTQGHVPEAKELEPYMTLQERGQSDFPARDVFADLAAVQQTIPVILCYEPYFVNAITQQTGLDKLEHNVDAMISKIETSTGIPDAYLTALHRLISMFAQFLDAYAAYLQAAQILEHCFVLSLQTLIRA